MSKHALRLRPADMADADLLLAWRNEPSTRQASRDTAAIERSDHLRWLQASLSNPNRRLLVAELDGIAVGTVRVDQEADGHVLSWTVPFTKRGSGIGKAMVCLLADSIHEEVRAEIRQGNIASVRIAEAAGLRFVGEVRGILHYRRSATSA